MSSRNLSYLLSCVLVFSQFEFLILKIAIAIGISPFILWLEIDWRRFETFETSEDARRWCHKIDCRCFERFENTEEAEDKPKHPGTFYPNPFFQTATKKEMMKENDNEPDKPVVKRSKIVPDGLPISCTSTSWSTVKNDEIFEKNQDRKFIQHCWKRRKGSDLRCTERHQKRNINLCW